MSPVIHKKLHEDSLYYVEFLRECLSMIEGVEENVDHIEKDIMNNRVNIEQLLMQKVIATDKGTKRSEDSWMMSKIQLLQEKMLENEMKMSELKERSEMQIIGQLK